MSQTFRLGGDPDQIRSSARQWSTFAQAAASAAAGIRSLDTSEFVGDEAETYQDQINSDLPKHLETAGTAWGVVAAALHSYASDLEQHQRTMSSLSVRADNQQATVESHSTSLDRARQADHTHALSVLQASDALKPGESLAADSYVSHAAGAQRGLTDAKAALQATYDAASTVRSQNAESVRRCRSEIDRAKKMRFEKPPGFWGRLSGAVCGWITDHAGVLLQISSVLKTISGIAGLLALIPIPVFQEVMAGVALVTGGAALLIDVSVKLATGKGSWLQIGVDALSMIPGARAAKVAFGATTGVTAYNVATGKASMSDLVMTVGLGAMGMKGHGAYRGRGEAPRTGNGLPHAKTGAPERTSLPAGKSGPPAAKPGKPVYEPVRRRVKLRAQTKRDVYARAEHAENGEDFVCATSGKTIPCVRQPDGAAVRVHPGSGQPDAGGITVPEKGSFHFGHQPGHEWRTYQVEAQANGYDRAQVISEQNNPDIYQLETPEANVSHAGEAR